MQKTIYIATPEIWESIKDAAGEKSISRYLVDLHETNVINQEVQAERKRVIAEEIELLEGI